MKKIPIIILPGWRVEGKRYLPLAQYLQKKGYIVYTIDFPGFDKYQTIDHSMHLKDYVEYVLLELKKLGLTEVCFFCHSFGGRVGLMFTFLYPKVVRTLFLSGVPGYSSTHPIKRIGSYCIAKIGHFIFSLPIIKTYSKVFSEKLYTIIRVPDYSKSNDNMRKTFKYVVAEKLDVFMKNIHTPTILLWGSDDRMVPVWVAQKMKHVIKNSQLYVYTNGTHALPFEEPSWLGDYIIKILGANTN
jgi:pimeloyl-ACP methyl ester carboxylesterase